MNFPPEFKVRPAVAVLLACIGSMSWQGAFSQSAYTPPSAYGSVPVQTTATTPGAAPAGGKSASTPVAATLPGVAGKPALDIPAGRPAPAAPMPMPLPLVQNALDQSVPMTPEEVTQLMQKIFERQRAGQQNVTGVAPARPVTSVEMLDLSPGSPPPVIRVTLGQGTVLSFSDSAGRPWPIADNLNFNQRAYEAKLIGPHLYSVTLKTREPANLTIVLKDLARPIVITALPATDETDYLKEYTVPRFVDGVPPASVAASSREGALSFNAPELINFLYRTPPKSARALTTSGLPGVTAWQIAGNKIIVRTAGQVVIPAFSRRHSGTDGVTVFELPLSPVVSITEGGALHRISLGGYSVDNAANAAASSATVAK